MKNSNVTKLVYCELYNNDYTIKIFTEKKQYFSNIVYENDTESSLIYQSKCFDTKEDAIQDAINTIEKM